MKATGVKILVVAVILAFTVSGAALACAGSESCRMPCCQASAGDSGRHDSGAGCPDGCGSAETGFTACSPAAVDVAPAPESHLILIPAVLSVADTSDLSAAPGPARQPGRTAETTRQKIPRFIQIRVLLV
ncbi:MAG: hypothetical protein EHM15_08365 [Desulfobacteraceae bacterium]|nr:MAG: hypothetical protein EHM15_08365 [Desulfobacteraceae bacterium]